MSRNRESGSDMEVRRSGQCAITLKPFSELKHRFHFVDTSNYNHVYDVEAITQWCLKSQGVPRDPVTRQPYNLTELKRMDRLAREAKLGYPSVYEREVQRQFDTKLYDACYEMFCQAHVKFENAITAFTAIQKVSKKKEHWTPFVVAMLDDGFQEAVICMMISNAPFTLEILTATIKKLKKASMDFVFKGLVIHLLNDFCAFIRQEVALPRQPEEWFSNETGKWQSYLTKPRPSRTVMNKDFIVTYLMNPELIHALKNAIL